MAALQSNQRGHNIQPYHAFIWGNLRHWLTFASENSSLAHWRHSVGGNRRYIGRGRNMPCQPFTSSPTRWCCKQHCCENSYLHRRHLVEETEDTAHVSEDGGVTIVPLDHPEFSSCILSYVEYQACEIVHGRLVNNFSPNGLLFIRRCTEYQSSISSNVFIRPRFPCGPIYGSVSL